MTTVSGSPTFPSLKEILPDRTEAIDQSCGGRQQLDAMLLPGWYAKYISGLQPFFFLSLAEKEDLPFCNIGYLLMNMALKWLWFSPWAARKINDHRHKIIGMGQSSRQTLSDVMRVGCFCF